MESIRNKKGEKQMKKIALCSILAVIMMPCIGWAAGSCGPHTLAYVGNQDPDDDEFLYQNQTQFNLSKQGWENTKHYNSGEGKGYECDNSGCPNNYELPMPDGHCFKGVCDLKARKYTCPAVRPVQRDSRAAFSDNSAYVTNVLTVRSA